MSWVNTPLVEIAELSLGKMLDEKKNRGQMKPYLANVNVRWGSFDLEHLRNMPFEESESDRFGLRFGDIVMCEGGEPGRCALWKEQATDMMYQKALHRIRAKENVDSRFLYYSFLKMGKSGEFAQLFTGSTIKHLPKEKLALVRVRMPDFPTQKAVANRLQQYDNLIENNERRIKLLDEAARHIYREWFVRLRFPGHEHTRIENGVPDGWLVEPLGKHIEIQSGFAFKSSTYEDTGEFGLVTIKNVQDGEFVPKCSSFVTQLPQSMPKHCRLESGDILLSLTGNVGRVCRVVGDKFVLNQRVAKLVPAPTVTPAYVYYLFRESSFRTTLESMSSGSAQQNLSPISLQNVKIALPKTSLMEAFTGTCDPMISQIELLKVHNYKLTKARDMLLPRFMSGKIEV